MICIYAKFEVYLQVITNSNKYFLCKKQFLQ